MLKLKFKRLNETAVIPHFATKGAACFDLTATDIEDIGEGRVRIYFGLAAEIPAGYKLEVSPRSSFGHKGWVMQNSPGQIDEDYKGEIAMYIQAIPQQVNRRYKDISGNSKLDFQYPQIPYKVGDRAAQCRLVKVEQYTIEETTELSESERGTDGFGSTGKGNTKLEDSKNPWDSMPEYVRNKVSVKSNLTK